MTKTIQRLVSLTMALVMVVGLGALSIGAPNVNEIQQGVFVTSLGYAEEKYQPGAVVDHISKDYLPGETINIYLDPAKFIGTDLDFSPEQGMSARDLENAGIQLRTSGGKNSNLIQNVSFQEQNLNEKPVAFIQVRLISNFTETDSRDFETTISLYANKRKAQSITVGGTLSNQGYEVGSGENYIYLGDGTVVTAVENIQNIEIDTGNRVSIHARLLKGRQYYAVSSLTPSNADAELLSKYPELEFVVNLSTSGFSEANVAKAEIESEETLYIYNGEGKYLGTTKDKVELASKYYLANEKVDFVSSGDNQSTSQDDDDITSPADDGQLPQGDGSSGGGAPDVDKEPPGSIQVGGGDSDIPDTGINTGFKIAIAAGVIAIVLIPILVITSKKDDEEEE